MIFFIACFSSSLKAILFSTNGNPVNSQLKKKKKEIKVRISSTK